MTIRDLEPRAVWEQFDGITRVPRPSKKEGRIIEYLVEFARRNGIECKRDRIGNVVMRRPAAAGYEDRPTVILQSHMDMVCEKNSDVDFDFENDAIRTRVGLTGAFGLGEGMLTGKYLINLDSEDEGEIFIGCAGGIDTVAEFRYKREAAPKGYVFYRFDVSELVGGHSGDDIDKGRANSNKIAARLLYEAQGRYDARLSYMDGGNLRNAIPREAYAVFGIPAKMRSAFEERYAAFAEEVKEEFRLTDPDMRLSLSEMPDVGEVMDAESQRRLVGAAMCVANGVVAMSQAVKGLVETSTNLASVKFVGEDRIVVTTSQRSSVESAKLYAMQTVEAAFALAGAEVSHSDGYPGWTPDPDSRLLRLTEECYRRLFGAEPKVRAVHAGLECGLFLEKYPELEMVSFGPTIRGVHSPDERLEIATVDKFWRLLREVVKSI